MTVPFWCLFIATILPIALSWVGGYHRQQQLGTIDNKEPRTQNAQLKDAGARAVAAQKNAWEALAVFTAAVMVAHLTGANPQNAAIAAVVFIVARLLHAAFYLANQDALRSLSFIIGYGCCVWLFLMAA